MINFMGKRTEAHAAAGYALILSTKLVEKITIAGKGIKVSKEAEQMKHNDIKVWDA